MTNISGIVKSARNIMRQDTGTGSDELRILQLGWMLFLKIFSDKDKELELIQDNYASPIPKTLHWDEWAGDTDMKILQVNPLDQFGSPLEIVKLFGGKEQYQQALMELENEIYKVA